MILGPVSYLDCIVFCILLAPQLIWRVGLFETLACVLRALPFLIVELPTAFIRDRYLVRRKHRSPFVQRASPFEDFVIRCVRYAFTNIPPKVGRVFFSKQVARPFLRFRMLRHGYLRPPISWSEHEGDSFRGIWLIRNPEESPDFVLYYAHGGGFSMGSTYFYLEFLLTWLSVLTLSGYKNPAIFALEYTLVPEASFPTQLHETIRGYRHVLSKAKDPSIVCIGGDSAGALLILSLLLQIGSKEELNGTKSHHDGRLMKPALALLISPWVTLVSPRHRNTKSDFLDVQQLHRYGRQFAGGSVSINEAAASPGSCKDKTWWKRSSPSGGVFITYGEEEVFAPEIDELIQLLRESGVIIGSKRASGGIHAWPVASLFLSSSRKERLYGLTTITKEIRERIPQQNQGNCSDEGIGVHVSD
ncbi:Alpha/Beta hydrolase protein [Lasiosphaeria miniovina]|uniref:Alpha/Beta hydrolase protein n=1 Tax=Lasiosphaeria miniovina TaxID=1954250 RepID=A0AA40DWP7_9PEZI|nr:Alpha/Beta hydrolase protein [Lasiosphaeria miniovina]KAK0718385.1 Alpha/Beta hydrolase protein [Lasiosphaeria miniovina]